MGRSPPTTARGRWRDGRRPTATLAGLRRRRLQSVAIAVVLLLATAAATLALSVLVASHEPFDRAFGEANGAHLVLRFAGTVDAADLSATSRDPAVTAAAGPWAIASGALGHPKGGLVTGASFSARPTPDPSIDGVTLSGGRWWRAPGEAVLDASTARFLGQTVGTRSMSTRPSAGRRSARGRRGRPRARRPAHLMVVGIAESVSTPDVTAWMSRADLDAVVPSGPADQEMLYASRRPPPPPTSPPPPPRSRGAATRFRHRQPDVAGPPDERRPARRPVRAGAARLLAACAARRGFLVANIVSGVVLTRSRDIGVMKAIGYTPRQVTLVLVGQTAVPALAARSRAWRSGRSPADRSSATRRRPSASRRHRRRPPR